MRDASDRPTPNTDSPSDETFDNARRPSILGRLVIFGVLVYRVTLGRVIGGHCRFQPTCSQYMIDAVRKHGAFRGAWRGVRRICRCHPFGGSGYDPA
ncbi:MAG: membrane protein insertion efficiency factor YidD [Phycisphaeraceae bacterium]|nr:membrane protein insertion efficiency factor YidD [Phycisphaeraceae bacterium]